MLQTPAEQLAVARRQQKAAAGKPRRGANQRLEALIAFCDRMPGESDVCSVAGDFAEMLDYSSRILVYRIIELTTTMVAVYSLAQRVARRNIGFDSRPYLIPGKPDAQRLTVEFRQQLTGFKAELCIEAERTVIKGCLHEPHPGDAALPAAREHIEHQLAANRLVLHRGIDGYWADAGNGAAFVEKVAAKHLAGTFGDDRIEFWMRQPPRHQTRRDLGRRERPRKVVFDGDRFESLKTDSATSLGVLGSARTQYHTHCF